MDELIVKWVHIIFMWLVFSPFGGCGGEDTYETAHQDEEKGAGYFYAPAASCDQDQLDVCIEYGGGQACYEKFNCPQTTCQVTQLKVCLKYNGGNACYDKWGCKSGDENIPDQDNDSGKQDAGGSTGAAFGDYYAKNYDAIRAKARQFHPGSYGCAAYASTALMMYGYQVSQVKVTNDVERQLQKLGWSKITDMSSLRKGDVVFTDKATSNIPGTWSHVYVFQRYANTSTAVASDNNGPAVSRNIYAGSRSKSIVAWRK